MKNVVFFLLDESPASEFYVSTFRNTLFHLDRQCKQPIELEQTECSEISVHKIQTPRNHPKERIQLSEHGGNLKTRTLKKFENSQYSVTNAVVDRTMKYFIFSYVLVTTEVNSAIDNCIHFFQY